ncbi:MAG: carboxymuconolactone decarboxylase family protein [Deltaproteobacteria bacterium]|nr:carboxymuconolactone decarboxylase family protein [Deltaproteobacteria bacterium]MBW2394423.1 carboxymuconolactone decarboxylase family protein [Deltaproteobacteria bacterium]
MSRIEPIEAPYPEDVAPILEAMMPPGVEPLGLFRVIAKNPRILGKIKNSNLLDRGSIERRDRELVILRTTARCASEYEWGVHVLIFAKRFGLTDEQIASTRTGSGGESFWSERDQALIGLVDELHDHAAVSDDRWHTLRAHFDEAQLVELVVLTGFYHTISFLTNAFEIDLEAASTRFPVPEAN